MSLRKYFTILTVITFLGICYVHQQFLIVEANYTIKKQERIFSQLLDRHAALRYNVYTLESPACLEAKLQSSGISYGMPRTWVAVKRSESKGVYQLASNVEKRGSFVDKFMNFIAVKAEAETVENKR